MGILALLGLSGVLLSCAVALQHHSSAIPRVITLLSKVYFISFLLGVNYWFGHKCIYKKDRSSFMF